MADDSDQLPPSVKIGHLDYALLILRPKLATEGSRYGECSHLSQEIRIDHSHEPRKVAQTLLHEITHAIWGMYGLEDEDKEERFVNVLANGWAQVWRDNPAVFLWIGERLANG